MKKRLVTGVLAAAVMALVGLQGTAAVQAAPPTFTVFAHFEYADGFNYDYPVARGVSTSQLPTYLSDCGSSHWTGSVVRYYCFPVPE